MKKGQEDLFLANPDLADVLGGTNLILAFLSFLDYKFPGPQISTFPDSRRRWRAGVGEGQNLRSQLDPCPNAPRGQIRRKEPFAADEGQEGISDQSRHESCHVTFLG